MATIHLMTKLMYAATIQGWPLIQDSIYSIKQLLSAVTIQYIK